MEKLSSLEHLIDYLSKLPSVGKKSAERMAYAFLDWDKEDIENISKSLIEVKEKIHPCPICGMLTEKDICEVCSSNGRNKELLMIVSFPKDVIAIEKSEGYNGLYHVLGGAISQSKGKGIESLSFASLEKRIKEGNFKEVIIATNPDVDGETTALYIAKKLGNYNVNITRLAFGLQMGGALDYTDPLTLSRALKGRTKI